MIFEFDQADYWIKRHERFRGNILSVGNEAYDQAGNELAQHKFLTRLQIALDLIGPSNVLDVGCGYGRAAPLFLQRGCQYTGVDVSPVAIEEARAMVHGGTFIVADLNHWGTDERFDLVAVLFVFIHFVDDEAWLSLLERCLKWVAPGGSLLFANRFARQVERNAIHTKTRPIGEYLPVLSKHGFVLDKELASRVADPQSAIHFHRAVRR